MIVGLQFNYLQSIWIIIQGHSVCFVYSLISHYHLDSTLLAFNSIYQSIHVPKVVKEKMLNCIVRNRILLHEHFSGAPLQLLLPKVTKSKCLQIEDVETNTIFHLLNIITEAVAQVILQGLSHKMNPRCFLVDISSIQETFSAAKAALDKQMSVCLSVLSPQSWQT